MNHRNGVDDKLATYDVQEQKKHLNDTIVPDPKTIRPCALQGL